MTYLEQHNNESSKGRLEQQPFTINHQKKIMTLSNIITRSRLMLILVGMITVGLLLAWLQVLPLFANEAHADPAPFTTFSQNDVQWFADAPGADLADALTVENTVLENSSTGDVVRLQMNVTIGASPLWEKSQTFVLQYAEARDCTLAREWHVVGGARSDVSWRLYDNVALNAHVDDATQLFTSDASGGYSETNPSQLNPYTVGVGSAVEWDWPLENNGARVNATYCFRMALAEGHSFDSYSADGYGKIVTAE